MPDRSRPPRIRAIETLQLPEPEQVWLTNGIPVYVVRSRQREVLRLECVFRAGRPVEDRPMVASMTLRMLREGTRHRSGDEVADLFEHYGSTISTPFNLDTGQVNVYCLARHVGEVLPTVAEMLADPIFPEEELRDYVKRRKRRLEVDLRKPDLVAYRQFTEFMFGSNHPYGYNSTPALYEAVGREDLERHFRTHYVSGNCFMVLAGAVDDRVLKEVDRLLGQAIRRGPSTERVPPCHDFPARQVHIDRPQAAQTAIRVGRKLFSRRHPDYEGMNILAHILGGYFGSRLMANIREKKGYTYNIYAMTDPLVHDGSFYVASEVGNEVVGPTLREIYREIDRLRNRPVGRSELEMVRSYMLGSYLNALDGPFSQADLIRGLLTDHLPLDAFDRAVEELRRIDPKRLQQLARTYLDNENMWEVVVGPRMGAIK